MDWPKSSLGFFYKMLPASYMTLAHSRNLDSIQRQKRTTKEFFPHLKLPITLSSDDQFYQLHTLVPKTPRYTHKHAKHMYTRMPSTTLIMSYIHVFSNILCKTLAGQGQMWYFICILPLSAPLLTFHWAQHTVQHAMSNNCWLTQCTHPSVHNICYPWNANISSI